MPVLIVIVLFVDCTFVVALLCYILLFVTIDASIVTIVGEC